MVGGLSGVSGTTITGLARPGQARKTGAGGYANGVGGKNGLVGIKSLKCGHGAGKANDYTIGFVRRV